MKKNIKVTVCKNIDEALNSVKRHNERLRKTHNYIGTYLGIPIWVKKK